MNNRTYKVSFFYLILLMVLLFFVSEFAKRAEMQNLYTYTQFQEDIESGIVERAVIIQNEAAPTGVVELIRVSGTTAKVNVPDTAEAGRLLQEAGIPVAYDNVRGQGWLQSLGVPLLVAVVVVFAMMMLMNRQSGGGNSRMMDFGRSRARMTTQEQIHTTFKDVAGLQEEKEDLREIVDFLKMPQKYIKVGARIPKGVLLEGPPGTGKTLLAKAVAGEAGVPFFSISGSDFVEMFVGVGASRVRDLFADAIRNHPCIVFIDEIDAVARRRGSGMGGGHDEREQTLNQLLVEMDGFGANEGIIVMAATNRVDILDPAILRPGRFDRKIMVGRPDVKGREEILHVHAKDKPLAEDVDLKQVAQTTAGMTGADLENLMNEAAIFAAKEDRQYILQSDIRKSFVKVGIGAEKKSRVVSEKEKRITAYHEAGHAILFHVLPDVGPVYTVSIIPTGMGAAGYTMPLPERDDMFNTKGKMLQDIQVSLGGRIAEELIFDDITTGASQDIKQATGVARAMVTKYGMSESLGLVNYDSDEEVFIGRDFGHTKGYGEAVASKIDMEIKRIVDECYQKAKDIILAHRKVLDETAQLLLEKERITREEFEALFEKDKDSPLFDS
ncbi:MAG: ATP-dependent zinc metalloprotease FtsH [Lachnospiraceae bacterium]|uniref:ATP-dependent zinc metalloprotease FtsH n=1 Tax=Candidatus Merdisoma sp. JLR.KK011 TaxID=3114299 RepID=UPI001433A164|nr:ATP-dependent zinc metalloprotease FtsH [Lachnospiraceae bacterium]MCI9252681.1 ATP-dependent zinc metalloprotease FtsH [Lachnospiraceae bacterium]MCI9383197.1 ATP-dependent zinc metalloprotease FtsH [Lachnospiraceae bacterium]MCI9623506.1 ATP-dependent zinc metalloprotease FtsH [Lachnospiraceae bacterium]GFI11680.1 ATP-dependent zinc metalloprotease FtsH [Lachnospiraceae bacterium]